MEKSNEKARVLMGCSNFIHVSNYHKVHLGNKGYDWDVPGDLADLAVKHGFSFIGKAKWNNTDDEFITIATPKREIIYFDVKAVKEMYSELIRKGGK